MPVVYSNHTESWLDVSDRIGALLKQTRIIGAVYLMALGCLWIEVYLYYIFIALLLSTCFSWFLKNRFFFLKNLSPKINLELHRWQVRSRRFSSPSKLLNLRRKLFKSFFPRKKIANFSTNTNFCEESAEVMIMLFFVLGGCLSLSCNKSSLTDFSSSELGPFKPLKHATSKSWRANFSNDVAIRLNSVILVLLLRPKTYCLRLRLCAVKWVT